MVAEIDDDGGHGVLFVLDARSQYLQEWVGIVVDLPLFEDAAVVPAGVMFDRHRWVAAASSSMRLSSWRPVRPFPSAKGWMFSKNVWNPAAFNMVCAVEERRDSMSASTSSYISKGSAVFTVVAVMRAM